MSKVRRGLLWAGEPGPRNRNDIARHALLATFVPAGVRISELAPASPRPRPPGGRLRVRARSPRPTPASAVIPLVPALREILDRRHRASRPYEPDGFVFATRTPPATTPTTSARDRRDGA